MKAVIMAGGAGSRLRPLTCDRPKPMVPIINRPMMEHIVSLLKSHRMTDIAVTLQYLPEQIRNYFGDGREFGVDMRYYIEDSPLGTAGSVKNAADFLDETFIVISGDALTDFDLQKALEFHRGKDALATLVLTSVEKPLDYGVVITAADGRIKQFLEKPNWGEVFSDTVNTGIYILEPEVLQYIPDNTQFDFAKDLFPLLMKKGCFPYGYVARGYWCDIGNLEQYHQAHLDILQGRVKVAVAEKETAPGIFLGENVVVEEGAELIAPVIIGSGSRIARGAKVQDCSVIGPQSLVDVYASVKRGVVWRNVYLGPYSEIRGAALAGGVQVLERSSLYEGVVVGDGTVVEAQCLIRPGVKIWPYKKVESGSIVAESLIWGARPARNLFGFDGISGRVNLDITPELVVKLSAAYGSLLGEGSAVAVSCDDWKASGMLKNAALAGLLSAGISVYDLGATFTPVTRYAVKKLNVKGAIHVQLGNETNTHARIRFFDKEGLALDKEWERKIEQAYHREDFNRIKGPAAGDSTQLSHFADDYKNSLVKRTALAVLKSKKYKVVLAYPAPRLYAFLVPLLQQLNCEVLALSAPEGEPLTFCAMREYSEEVSAAVRALGADVGVIMDANAENLLLFDGSGRIIADDLYLALSTLIVFKSKSGTVAVPVTAPEVIEALADLHQGKVLRTKTAPRSLMEVMMTEKARIGPYDMFTLSFDAIHSIVNILQFMESEKTSLAEIVDSIPPFYLHRQDVDCSWGVKGRVMRRLIEETSQMDVELLDGVKVRHPQGWALVLPDSERPFCRVYGEGFSAETAAELTDIYVNKIKELRDQPAK